MIGDLPSPADPAGPIPPPVSNSLRKQVATYGRGLLVAAAFTPLTAGYFMRLWSLPHYQLFPLTLLGGVLLARRDVFSFAANDSASAVKALVGSAVCYLALAAAFVADSPWLAYAALLGELAVALYRRGGAASLRRGIPALLMGLCLLRPPGGLDEQIILGLQAFTARAASRTLDFIGVLHHLAGNVIELPGRNLMVEEACAGLTSLISAWCLTLFYCLWSRRSAVRTCALLLSVPVWTVVANVGRITAISSLRYYADIAADEGFLHELSGIAAFWTAMLLIWSTDNWFGFFAAVVQRSRSTVKSAREPVSAATTKAPSSRRWSTATGLLGAMLWAGLVVAQVRTLALGGGEVSVAELRNEFMTGHERLFPPTDGGGERTNVESIERLRSSAFGQFTERADYRVEAGHLSATVDYPFLGWHDLATCYTAQGWTIASRRTVRDSAGVLRVEMELQQFAQHRYGYCVFTLLDEHGEALTPPSDDRWARIRERIRKTVGGALRFENSPAHDAADRVSVQTQVFFERYSPPSAELKEAAVASWQRLVARTAAILKRSAPPSPPTSRVL